MAVLKNIVSKIFNLSTTPSKKTEGQFWYDTTNNVLKRSDGTDYKPLAVGDNLISATSTDTVKGILNSKANASDLASYLPLTGGTINGNFQNPAPLIINDTSANWNGYVSDVGLVVRGTWLDEKTLTTYNLSTKITPVSITGDAVTDDVISGSNKLLTSRGAYTALQSKANASELNNYLKKTGDNSLVLGNYENGIEGTIFLNSEYDEFFYTKITGTNGIEIGSDVGRIWLDPSGYGIRFGESSNIHDADFIVGFNGISGHYIDNNLATELKDGHIATSKAIKSYVDTSVSNKADNTNVVHLSGAEVITGNKLFTSSIKFSSFDTFNTNLAGVSVPEYDGNPGTPPTLIIDRSSNITIDASNMTDSGLNYDYNAYGIISGVNSDGATFRIDGKDGSASFSSLHTGSISGSAVVSTIGTSTTSIKLPTEGAIVKAISDVKTSLGSALTYEGSVENYSNLPTGLTASDKGKVYNVVNANGNIPAGTNYAWNGTSWDALGGDMSAYLRKEGDTTLELGSSIDDETGYTMIPGKITVNGEYHGQYTEITKDQIALESDVGSTLINGGRLYLNDRRGTNVAFIIDDGIGGTLVDTLIPSTPEDGHIATTGAIKTYVDNSTSNKVEKNSDAELNAFIMPTYNSSGVQNGKAKIILYKDDTTGAITIEAEEITE